MQVHCVDDDAEGDLVRNDRPEHSNTYLPWLLLFFVLATGNPCESTSTGCCNAPYQTEKSCP